MNEKPGLEPGFFFARRATGGLTGYALLPVSRIAMLAGLVLSIIFVSVRNLTAPIIAHTGFDAFYFAGSSRFFGGSTTALHRISS